MIQLRKFFRRVSLTEGSGMFGNPIYDSKEGFSSSGYGFSVGIGSAKSSGKGVSGC